MCVILSAAVVTWSRRAVVSPVNSRLRLLPCFPRDVL